MIKLFTRSAYINGINEVLDFYYENKSNGYLYKIYTKKIGDTSYRFFEMGGDILLYIDDAIDKYSKWLERGFKDGISPGDIENLKRLRKLINRDRLLDKIL